MTKGLVRVIVPTSETMTKIQNLANKGRQKPTICEIRTVVPTFDRISPNSMFHEDPRESAKEEGAELLVLWRRKTSLRKQEAFSVND